MNKLTNSSIYAGWFFEYEQKIVGTPQKKIHTITKEHRKNQTHKIKIH